MDQPLPPVSPPLDRDTLVSRINAALADNTSQFITPEDIRSRLLEMVDSTVLAVGSDNDARLDALEAVDEVTDARLDALEVATGVVPDLSTKSPYIRWPGTPTLSLGTSIPHQGGDLDSYLEMAVGALGGSLVNMAFSGSHARYNIAHNPESPNELRALSMTEDDRQWGLATYGGSSAYAGVIDMTCDWRIDAPFAATPFKVVFFDHNHNDRGAGDEGTPTAESQAIVSITKGATTQVTLASIGTIVAGNGVVLQLTGIDNLNHAAQRVMSVAGNVITLNIDSASYPGTFGSGTCTKYDRATVHGSFRFLYHRIRRAAFLAGVPDPIIIYNGAPSEYTGGAYDARIRANAELIKTIADELDCAFFDEAAQLRDSLEYHTVYFPDLTHPTQPENRRVLANLWARWLAGGGTPALDPSTFVPAPAHDPGTQVAYEDQAPVIYSKFLGGAGTPGIIVGEPVPVLVEGFALGIGSDWTVNGTTPVVEAAPWGVGQAIKCVATAAGHNSYLSQGITVGRGRAVQFDFWLPTTSGLTATASVKGLTLCQIRVPGAYMNIAFHIDMEAVTWAPTYFETPNVNIQTLRTPQDPLLPNRKYQLRWEWYQGSSVDDPGRLLFYLDDILFGGPYALNDWDQDPVTTVYFGAIGSNTGLDLTVYVGNLIVSDLPVQQITNSGTLDSTAFVPAPVHEFGVPVVYTDQAPLIYSKFLGGAGTPSAIIAAPVVKFTDNFAAGLGTWANNGTAPVFMAAPWGSGQSIKCVSVTGAPSSYLSRSLTLDRGRIVEFDLYLPDVAGVALSTGPQITLVALRAPGGYLEFGLRAVPTGITFANQYFKTNNTTLVLIPRPTFTLAEDTKYHIRYETYQGSSAGEPGQLLMYVNNVLIGGPDALDDFGQVGPVSTLRFGAIGGDTENPLNVYLGNLSVSDMAAGSLATRVTGNIGGIDFVGGWAVGGTGTSLTPGTWTPTFAFATPGDSVITHTTQVGKYLKLGNIVLVMMDIAFNTNAYTTAAGAGTISGLPYPVASPGGSLAIGLMNNVTYTAASQEIRLECLAGGSLIQPRLVTSNAAVGAVGIASFVPSKTGIGFRASGLYWTNS